MPTLTAPPEPTLAPHDLDHISYSSLKTYQTCPRKFRYKYLDQTPEEFVPASLIFGGAVHRAIEAVHEARIQAKPIPELETLHECYQEGWKETLSQNPEIQFGKDDNEQTLADLASRMLSAYRDHAIQAEDGGTQIVAIEQANRFKLIADVPPIESRIDLIELNGTDLIVTDFKTSKSRWNDAKALESLPQLILYANSTLSLVKELEVKRLVPQFVVITKAKKPAVQVLRPTASQADVDRLKQDISDTWTAIKAGIFVKRESWACSQCPFKGCCLGR